MPASISIAGFSTSRTRTGANSALNTAASTESGTANSMAMTTTLTVPVSNGMSPYLGMSPTGCHNGVAKNPRRLDSFWVSASNNTGQASLNTNTTIRISAATAENAQARSPNSITASRRIWAARTLPRACTVWPAGALTAMRSSRSGAGMGLLVSRSMACALYLSGK